MALAVVEVDHPVQVEAVVVIQDQSVLLAITALPVVIPVSPMALAS
jgi:hypothetical protein